MVDCVGEERTIDMGGQAEFGVDHGQVGGWLAEAWRLPTPIVVAIRDHHQQLPTATQWSPERVVSIADQLVHGTDIGSGALARALRPLPPHIIQGSTTRPHG